MNRSSVFPVINFQEYIKHAQFSFPIIFRGIIIKTININNNLLITIQKYNFALYEYYIYYIIFSCIDNISQN